MRAGLKLSRLETSTSIGADSESRNKRGRSPPRLGFIHVQLLGVDETTAPQRRHTRVACINGR